MCPKTGWRIRKIPDPAAQWPADCSLHSYHQRYTTSLVMQRIACTTSASLSSSFVSNRKDRGAILSFEAILRPLSVTLIIPHPTQDNKFYCGALVKKPEIHYTRRLL